MGDAGLMGRLTLGLTVACCLAGSAHAEQPEEFKLHQAVMEEAFDPQNFFQYDYFGPILTVQYFGYDHSFDVPVYSIAIFRGCHSEDGEGAEECRNRLQARMVRAPYEGEPERPRFRGWELIDKLKKAGVSNRASLLAKLDQGVVEWMETDLSDCTAAMKKLRASEGLKFLSEPLVREPEDGIRVMVHSDSIKLVVDGSYTYSTFIGAPEQGNPGAWAEELAVGLEPCWTPSNATPPWRRVAKDKDD